MQTSLKQIRICCSSWINDILDLSKIEAGTFDFYPALIDVNQTLEEIEQSMQLRLRHNNVTCTFVERTARMYII